MNLKISVTDTVSPWLKDIVDRQMAYITSESVKGATREALLAEQMALRGNPGFVMRKHVEKTLVIQQYPTKQNPTGVIGPMRERDVLSKHQIPGFITPQRGPNLAVPLGARPTPQSNIPSSLTPKGLGSKAFRLITNSGTFLAVRVTKATATRRRKRGLAVRGRDPRLVLEYILEPKVPTSGPLHFGEAATRAVTQKFPELVRAALAKAIRTAR